MYVPTSILIATGELFARRNGQTAPSVAAEIAQPRGLQFQLTDAEAAGIAWSEDGVNWFQHIGNAPGGRFRHHQQKD